MLSDETLFHLKWYKESHWLYVSAGPLMEYYLSNVEMKNVNQF